LHSRPPRGARGRPPRIAWSRVSLLRRLGARRAVIAAAVAVACVASAAAGYFAFSPRGSSRPPVRRTSAGSTDSPRPGASSGTASASASQATAPAPAALPKLSLAQLAGQRVIYSYHGLTPPAALLSLISHGEAAGVIFFGGNVSSLSQLASVIAELEKANASPANPVRSPLLLMTDQEGGIIRRIPGAPLLSERQIGESADPVAQATEAGTSAAQNLRGAGMNVNLAPVLDVFRQPGDFDDQNGRSYSTDPDAVSLLGSDFITAQQRGGVAATAKHFPGLGAAATAQDTDNGPVTLNVPASVIRSTDELPYKAAIAAGVRLVMVSWAVYPALAPGRPAGLSPAIVGGELRQRLGFRGVTITDALEAGALRPFGSIGNRGLLAAQAGMDLLLCSAKYYTEGLQATAGLEQGYRDGQLSKPAFTASVQRVLALRAGLGG
jgi:beta-N-acetylhexosaminidase